MELRQVDKYTVAGKEHEAYLKEISSMAENGPYRPFYHICPPCGLLNDPNGLCFYGGEYHVFYQWHPFGPSHGMKHWAHVKSGNPAGWKWCDEMLIPDQEYEKNGCYSGNAFVNESDGLCYLFYTANYKTQEGRVPKQAVAVMDPSGHIEKYKGNPVIDGAPEDMSGDIRDPFVFERGGRYYMLLGASDLSGRGSLILYSGETLTKWHYEGPIHVPLPDLGTMVECPGIIEVDGREVLLLSIIGLKPEKNRYHNQFSSLYMTGRLDLERMEFQTEHYDEIDCGFDFYAPQVFYGKGGQPMLFGWFGCGEQKLPEDAFMWRHGLTMARSLSVKNGRLYALPASGTAEGYETFCISGRSITLGNPQKPCKLELSVDQNVKVSTLTVGETDDFWQLNLNLEAGCVTWDRRGLKKKVDPAYGMIRSAEILPCESAYADIYIDNSFVEIFINGGERVFSGRIYIQGSAAL